MLPRNAAALSLVVQLIEGRPALDLHKDDIHSFLGHSAVIPELK